MREKISGYILSGETACLSPKMFDTYIMSSIKTVFAFLSTKKEIDTLPLIQYALDRGKTVAVPQVSGKNLGFHQITSSAGPFTSGIFGLREPPENSPQLFPFTKSGGNINFPLLILVPAMAFTVRGDRLGKGGGYYDRFLASLIASYPSERSRITIAGVSWAFQIIDFIPVEVHDIKVDCLYSENGCILC